MRVSAAKPPIEHKDKDWKSAVNLLRLRNERECGRLSDEFQAGKPSET